MDTYICESCNKQFEKPEKINKFLYSIGLLFLYGLIQWLILLSGTFIAWYLIWLINLFAIFHILSVIFRNSGRGKCPYCSSTDFVCTDSVKGQEIIRQIKKLKKH